MPSDRFWNVKFAWLRYAAAWAAYGAMRAVVLLPFRLQLALGQRLGALAYACARRRRRVASRNLEVCFPAMPASEREALVRAHFRALGASLIEMSMGWFGGEERIRRRIRVEGAAHLAAALEHGRGVILFSGHFTTFEFFWPALAALCPRLTGMYKAARNPVMNKVMMAGRKRHYQAVFEKTNVRAMLKELAKNSVVWYASDQAYVGKGSALLPFFGEPAMTNTAICRIARASGAAVLPFYCRRLDDGSYQMLIGAPLADLPSGDDALDVQRLTALLEDFIRTCPEQYWWIHQRFKGRPPPYPDIYAAAASPA